jgi:hypothetical protein
VCANCHSIWIISFFYKLTTGISFEIPYLTVNIADVGLVETKMNSRGEFYKLMSTYNNGNVLGICLLIIVSLYLSIEKISLFKILLFATLLLTLSRTVWIGMLLLFLFYTFNYLKIKPLISIFLFCFSMFFVMFILPFIVDLIGFDINFLYDKNLGNRIEQFSVLSNLSLFGNAQHVEDFKEIVYLSILGNFGILGSILFFIYITAPWIACKFFKIKNSMKWGIIIYIIICASDGCILHIPVMAFFWFNAFFALSEPNINHGSNVAT